MASDLTFAGWFQARLATDPDPHDEPVGVSGYTWALPGEPDLDRILRFQPEGAHIRPGCAPEIEIGVTVRSVTVDGVPAPEHPWLGAGVSFGGDAVFEGRNGIIAGNGVEPIVPLEFTLLTADGAFGRSYSDTYRFPFTELRAKGIDFGDAAEVARVTGIDDLGAVWRARVARLRRIVEVGADRAGGPGGDDALREACLARIEFMETELDLVGDFGLRVRYAMALRGPIAGRDLAARLPLDPSRLARPWRLAFWMGGWDFDSQCGYVSGELSLGCDGRD